MEVSTVSPPPTSPTEGGDLCDIDVTNVAIHTVTLLICLCGLAGNGAVLWLLKLNDIAALIISLAVADFLFLLFMVPSALLFLVEDVFCSPILPPVYVRFLFQLSMVSYYWALFFPTVVVLGFCIFILCEKCCHWHLSKRLVCMLVSALFWAFFVLIIIIPRVTQLCPAHEQEGCRVALTSMYALCLLLVAPPMVIFIIINIIKAKCGSQQQQPKRHDIVIFLILLLTLLISLWNFLQQFGYIAVSSQVDFLLTCIYSSIKPFIYFLVGRCRRPCSVASLRESLRRVFEEQKENTASSNDATRDNGA